MNRPQIPAAGLLGDAIRAAAGDLAMRVVFAQRLEQEFLATETEQASWIVFLLESALPYIERQPRSERREGQ